MCRVALVSLLLALPVPAAAQPTTTITGVVVDGVTEAPLADVRVESTRQVMVTDSAGRFSIQLDARETTLRFETSGYLDTVVPVEGTVLEVRLFSSAFAETVEVVSDATIQDRPSSTPVTPEQVFRAPGSIDNVFRTLDTLPGVVSTDDFGSRLAVRGGTPDQNLTIMDGVDQNLYYLVYNFLHLLAYQLHQCHHLI